MIGGQVTGREGLVPEEAGPDCCSCQRCPQARRVRWQQFEALDEELPRFLGAHLGRFFDVWIHHLGKPYGVDRVLVGGVEFGQHAAQHCPDHIGRQPGDPLVLQQPLGQCGLAYPGWATDEVEDMAGHSISIPAGRERWLVAGALVPLTELNQLKRDTSRSQDRYAGHPGMARRIAGSRRPRKIRSPTSGLLAGMYSGRWNPPQRRRCSAGMTDNRRRHRYEIMSTVFSFILSVSVTPETVDTTGQVFTTAGRSAICPARDQAGGFRHGAVPRHVHAAVPSRDAES